MKHSEYNFFRKKKKKTYAATYSKYEITKIEFRKLVFAFLEMCSQVLALKIRVHHKLYL